MASANRVVPYTERNIVQLIWKVSKQRIRNTTKNIEITYGNNRLNTMPKTKKKYVPNEKNTEKNMQTNIENGKENITTPILIVKFLLYIETGLDENSKVEKII